MRLSRLAAVALGALLVLGAAPPTHAQLFLASKPHPDFSIGPLFVRANVGPRLSPVEVAIFWSLVIPPHRSGSEIEQDLYLLWPGKIIADPTAGAPEPALARYVEARGFSVTGQGRVPVFARNLFTTASGRQPPERLRDSASFVTFVRQNGLGPTTPASYIHIPWSYRLTNPTWLLELRMTLPDLIQPKKSTWLEQAFWGHRQIVSISFSEVRNRAIFPMYFENRERAVKLSDDPAQLLINFADADHLKIDEVAPPTANRQASESRDGTEVVSLFLERSEGLKPQVLKVQFAYFRGLQTWMPILIPALFFLLGNLAGPLVSMGVRRLGRTLSARVHLGGGNDGLRQTGVVLSRETLEHIAPGETTYDQVLALCGREVEESESLKAPEQRLLIYRGRRIVPRARFRFGWLSTVSHWDVEHHEVEIAIEHGTVRDVQARVRRSKLTHPDLD